ncbi:uncharacterized protein LOC110862334 [Folsomia candida]|uniref:Uncharacterized protein n=1 Tax=Folsomia candida TaxID=158441 RepID=A0A226CWA0_FOLCA|nr:uncharacterized protein LOC110862334 [Folsomia candida]OXA37635.1 hypothetical protein Fcan01_27603 [Folsomia candida]
MTKSNASTFFWAAGVCLLSAAFVCHATMGGQRYSVNIHFVPPLVTGACNVAQFWTPPNVTCAWCFCMTGTLSRCIPQPGCTPANETTTAAPNGTTTATTMPSPMQNNPPGTAAPSMVTPSTAGSTAAAPTPAPSAPPAEATSQAPALATNLIRKRRGARKTKAKF